MAEIQVEVVFALSEKQCLEEVTLPGGATVADAIEASSLAQSFPDENLGRLEVGIWGRVVTRDTVLSDSDRVEIYRSLEQDPKEARRQLALAGHTMANRSKEKT